MTKTSLIASLSIALGALASNAVAQTPATPAPAPAAPAAAAPAPVSPAQKTAINELLTVTKMRDNLGRAFQGVSVSLPQQVAQAINQKIEEAPISPEQKQKVRESMNTAFPPVAKEAIAIITDPKNIDQTFEKMVPIYAKHFTLDEIKQLTAFYKSPIGQKAQAEIPQAVNETMQAGAAVFQPKIVALIDRTAKTQIDAVVNAKK